MHAGNWNSLARHGGHGCPAARRLVICPRGGRKTRLPPCAWRVGEEVRHGVTLVELLVVVSILMMLMVVAVPVIRPGLDSRRMREAARQVSVYLASAQTQAARLGRPVGVELVRDPDNPQLCRVLQQVEVPPPYAGDTVDTRLALQRGNLDPADGRTYVAAQLASGTVSPGLFRKGDWLQVNYQGPYYQIVDGPDADNDGFLDGFPLTLKVDLRGGRDLPWPAGSWSVALPFQIFRSPEKGPAAPLRLPEKTCIDLAFSGTDTLSFQAGLKNASGNWVADGTSVLILFSPSGGVGTLWRGQMQTVGTQERSVSTAFSALESIFLLVGRPERVPRDLDPAVYTASNYTSLAEDGLLNWRDLMNLIVAIRPQNGLITTSEVASVTQPGEDFRDYAREAQTMGGR